jgi:hypothetical protein
MWQLLLGGLLDSGCTCLVRLELYVLESVIMPIFRVHKQSIGSAVVKLVDCPDMDRHLEIWLAEYQ